MRILKVALKRNVLYQIPITTFSGQEDVKDVKGLKEGEAKSVEEQEKDTCSNLDRIMCQIVDQLSQDLEWSNSSFRWKIIAQSGDLKHPGIDPAFVRTGCWAWRDPRGGIIEETLFVGFEMEEQNLAG